MTEYLMTGSAFVSNRLKVPSDLSLLSKTELASSDGSVVSRRLSWGPTEGSFTDHQENIKRSNSLDTLDNNVMSPTFRDEKVSMIREREIVHSQKLSFLDSTFTEDIKELTNLDNDNNRASFRQSVKGLRFTTLEIREYSVVPGDHPGGYRGVPITISWEPLASTVTTVNRYEEIRKGRRRSFRQLKLPADKRYHMLRELGYSRAEIQEWCKKANLARSKRKATNSTLHYQKYHEKLESLRDHARNLFSCFQGKKKDQEFIMSNYPSYEVQTRS